MLSSLPSCSSRGTVGPMSPGPWAKLPFKGNYMEGIWGPYERATRLQRKSYDHGSDVFITEAWYTLGGLSVLQVLLSIGHKSVPVATLSLQAGHFAEALSQLKGGFGGPLVWHALFVRVQISGSLGFCPLQKSNGRRFRTWGPAAEWSSFAHKAFRP